MALAKYIFNPGDTLPAINVNSIDPDNINNQTFGKLVGGTDVVLANFQTLALGDNDGAIKIDIDGVEYDNVSVNLINTTDEVIISQTSSSREGLLGSGGSIWGQTFTTLATSNYLKSITVRLARRSSDTSGSVFLKVYATSAGLPTGSVLKTVEKNVSEITGVFPTYNDYEFDIDLKLESETQYYFHIESDQSVGGGNGVYVRYQESNVYGGGTAVSDFTDIRSDKDLYFKVNAKLPMSSLSTIASSLQSAIRTATSGQETVQYVTDHFEVNSGTFGVASSVLKFEAPTTGTDISGAGYLDLGANATETNGQGDEYKLMRLGAGGSQIQVKSGTLTAPNETVRINTGFKVKNVRIFLTQLNGYGSMGGWTEDGGNRCVYFSSGAGNLRTDFCYYHPGNVISGYIDNVDGDGFDIVGSVTSNTGYLYWEAN